MATPTLLLHRLAAPRNLARKPSLAACPNEGARSGFGLIETFVALGLLGIIVLAISSLLGGTSRTQAGARLITARDEIVRRIRASAQSVGALQTSALLPGLWGTLGDGRVLNARLRDCLDVGGDPADPTELGYASARGCQIPITFPDRAADGSVTAWSAGVTANALGSADDASALAADVVLFPSETDLASLPGAPPPGSVAPIASAGVLLARAVSGPWSSVVRPPPGMSTSEFYTRSGVFPIAQPTVRYDQRASRCELTSAPGSDSEACPLIVGTRFRAKCRDAGVTLGAPVFGPGVPSMSNDVAQVDCAQLNADRIHVIEIDYWVGVRQDFPGGAGRLKPASGTIVVALPLSP